VLPPLIAFVALMAMAMSAYPGGTWEEPKAVGHSQVRNFLCDLTRPTSLNGTPNESGSRYAELGLLAYAVALIPFFLIMPAVFPDRRRTGRIAAIAGVLAGIGGVGIVMVPSYKYGPLLHGIAVLLTAIPGLTAALSATIGVFTTQRSIRPIRAAAVATLVVTAAAVVMFALQLARGDETTTGLPVLEKLALGCSIAWMLFTVAAMFPREPRPT
jgi:hypothetical protein